MTREEFIKVLEGKGYSYVEEGNKIVVTHRNPDVYLHLLISIPSGVQFNNEGNIYLKSLRSIPPDTDFRNKGSIGLNSITTIPSEVQFKNGGNIYLGVLTGKKFRIFNDWEGNIEGLNSTKLLNKMISLGLFERKK
jgi:hypothetical protein